MQSLHSKIRSRGNILNTDQAFDMLKEAGITDNFETFRYWLREGKIKATGFTIDEHSLKMFMKEQKSPNKDELIHQLKLKIKVQEEQIKGMEEIHRSTTKHLFNQRDKVKKEIVSLTNKINELKQESIDLLKENIELRDELIVLKERLANENSSGNHYFQPTSQLNDFRQKLGLSKKASDKEVLARYKELLKLAHPDRGGNAKLFQYIKADYDYIRS
jgi:regulator of replication initiation timing